ncbi:hypothetical protein ACLB2K_057798 [Fragaria x ananassa]
MSGSVLLRRRQTGSRHPSWVRHATGVLVFSSACAMAIEACRDWREEEEEVDRRQSSGSTGLVPFDGRIRVPPFFIFSSAGQ